MKDNTIDSLRKEIHHLQENIRHLSKGIQGRETQNQSYRKAIDANEKWIRIAAKTIAQCRDEVSLKYSLLEQALEDND